MNRNNNTGTLATLALCLALPSGADGKSKGLKGLSGYSIYVESAPVPEAAESDPK